MRIALAPMHTREDMDIAELRASAERWMAEDPDANTRDELRALRELKRQTEGPFVFETERGTPFTPDAINRLVKRIGERAKVPFKVHAHMLRHACGYALANKGHDTRAIQDYLGHRNIQHTTKYTELSSARFKDFWRE